MTDDILSDAEVADELRQILAVLRRAHDGAIIATVAQPGNETAVFSERYYARKVAALTLTLSGLGTLMRSRSKPVPVRIPEVA